MPEGNFMVQERFSSTEVKRPSWSMTEAKGGEAGGLFAGEIAGGVERVDADIHQRAAAGEFFVETPLAGSFIETEGGFDGLDLADGAGANEIDGLEVGGLEVAAIGDHELDVGGFAGGDHPLTLGDIDGHGLFAEDVLAGLGRANGEVGVHGVGQRDVDGVDSFVGDDGIEVVVGVDGGFGDSVVGGDAEGLVAMAADERRDLGVGGIADAGHEDGGDAAEADDGVAGLAPGSLGKKGRSEARGKTKRAQ